MRGFSLVELSIVLVILGLLTGGILAGQSLIRASELRAVTSEIQRIQAAQNTFRDKYFQLPGDMSNATQFWGAAHATPATCRTTASTTQATCDGNGDGQVNTMDGSVTYSERHRYWQHLANAGLIEGNYTGVAGGGGTGHVIPGTNGPRSKISNAGYGIIGLMNAAPADVNYYEGNYGNAIFFGAGTSAATTQGATLKPEEMWNLDTKMDDGRPAFGSFVSYKPAFLANCSTSATASSAEYNLTFSGQGCAIVVKNP